MPRADQLTLEQQLAAAARALSLRASCGRASSSLSLVFGPIVPCALLVASVALPVGLKRALVAEGFRFGWLRSEPPAPAAT